MYVFNLVRGCVSEVHLPYYANRIEQTLSYVTFECIDGYNWTGESDTIIWCSGSEWETINGNCEGIYSIDKCKT